MLQVANPSMRHLAQQTPCRVAGVGLYPPSTHSKIQGRESDRFIKADFPYSKYIYCSLRSTENVPEPVRLSFHCSEMYNLRLHSAAAQESCQFILFVTI